MDAKLASNIQFKQQKTEADINFTFLKILLGRPNKSLSTKISEKKQVN